MLHKDLEVVALAAQETANHTRDHISIWWYAHDKAYSTWYSLTKPGKFICSVAPQLPLKKREVTPEICTT